MRKSLLFFATLLFFFSQSVSLLGTCVLPNFLPSLFSPMVFSLGPEVYSLLRTREGGSRQKGTIQGIFARFERIKPTGWYYGGDYLYATGNIQGNTKTHLPLRSFLTDEIYEFRVGYTLQNRTIHCPTFTPFLGGGFFRETNVFLPPSYNLCTFEDCFPYVVTGFLSQAYFTPWLRGGVNFKVRFMLHGTSWIQDRFRDYTVEIGMNNQLQACLELPLSFQSPYPVRTGFQLTPFYEFRHFGGKIGYPYNFKDTKLYLYGARLTINFVF